jgi:hypothetical protein
MQVTIKFYDQYGSITMHVHHVSMVHEHGIAYLAFHFTEHDDTPTRYSCRVIRELRIEPDQQ